ncbi:MAG: ATP synthase subunit I [Candidatus Goldiibacteriota bacterium]|jgi:hypothetical protein
MEKSKAAILASGAAAFLICGGIYFADKRLSLGMFAGYLTGVLNYLLIESQVKKILGAAGNTAVKVTAGGFFYILRLLVAAAVIAAVLINRRYFSIAGFLAGFTLCVAAVFTAHKMNP